MLAGYSFLRFKCSPQNTAAEKPKVGCFGPVSSRLLGFSKKVLDLCTQCVTSVPAFLGVGVGVVV